MTGRFQSAAMFITSYQRPCAVAPSPKKQTVTSSLPWSLARQRRAGGDPHGAADDGVGAQVAVALVGDVHRPALAPAIALRLAEQFAEHLLELSALGHAMPVAAMGGGDAVVIVSASQMPTATASSPEYMCVSPGILAER
jgi:hypothetical protein